jgi:hypothetical protein
VHGTEGDRLTACESIGQASHPYASQPLTTAEPAGMPAASEDLLVEDLREQLRQQPSLKGMVTTDGSACPASRPKSTYRCQNDSAAPSA